MPPRTCIAVPTYWTRAGGEQRSGDAVYDHPTAIDELGTLPRLLESLEQLDTSAFFLLLLVAVTGEDIADEAEQRVRRLVEGFPDLSCLVFGPLELSWLYSRLAKLGFSDAPSLLGLQTYPKVRNLQLVVPHGLGAKAVVALDDDEFVDDPLFLEKALEPLGTELHGIHVDGLSGFYLQEDGGIYLRASSDESLPQNIFSRKAAIMNAATAQVEEEPDNLVETSFCFGGNMTFSSELAAMVGFDPGITRGEDIDYLINARMEDQHFFMRKDLRVEHRPPAGGSYRDVSLSKLEQDILRFIYEREKLMESHRVKELHAVSATELMPYPGEFLAADLRAQASAALESAGYPGNSEKFLTSAEEGVADKFARYLEFRQRWPLLQGAVDEDTSTRDHLLALVK